MHRSFFPGILPLLLIMLLGGPAVAEEAPKQAPAPTQGKSLADPDQQRQADDAMHTEGGKAGRDEPGVHAPLDGDQPVLKDGKLNVPSAPSQSNSPAVKSPRVKSSVVKHSVIIAGRRTMSASKMSSGKN